MLLNSLLPKDIKLKKFSFSSNPGYFQAVLAQGISEPQQIAAEFRRRTGLELRLSLPNQEPPEPSKFIKDVAFRHVDDRQELHIQISAKEPHFNRLAATEPDARRTMRKNARGATLLLPAQATLKSTSTVF